MNAIHAVFHRDWRQRMNNIGFMFWDLLAPLAYLVLFGTGFERAMGGAFEVDGQPIGYAAFLLPGVLAMTTFSVAMNTSWAFFMDKDSGIFYEVLTYPITRRQFLLGKIGFNVLLSVTGCTMAVALGATVMGAPIRWALLPLTVAAVSVSTAGWFFLFSNFAIRMNRMDDFNTFTSACYILLMFLSTMFYPTRGLPFWFRLPTIVNPMTWEVDTLRFTLLGLGDPMTVAIEAAAFTAFTLLCLGVASRTLERVS